MVKTRSGDKISHQLVPEPLELEVAVLAVIEWVAGLVLGLAAVLALGRPMCWDQIHLEQPSRQEESGFGNTRLK